MERYEFARLYNQFLNDRNVVCNFKEFIVDEDTTTFPDISLEELRRLISTFSSDSKNKKIFMNYLSFLEKHSINKEEVKTLNREEFLDLLS